MEAEDGICSSQETTVTLGGPRHKQRVESLPTAAEAAAIARVQAEAARCDREEANATASGLLTAERATTLATQHPVTFCRHFFTLGSLSALR